MRVLNASTNHDAVTVKVGSQTVASDLSFAAASPYTDVSAGSQTVTMTSGGTTKTSTASLPAGSVHTLFVLDTASGGLTVSPILESSAAAVTPNGAIDTGAGGLADSGEAAGARRRSRAPSRASVPSRPAACSCAAGR